MFLFYILIRNWKNLKITYKFLNNQWKKYLLTFKQLS